MLQETALKVLQTGTNVFLTGEPGSGKTHTINAYVAWLRDKGIEPAITASTGIAATHVGGMTIHSWSGIGVREVLTEWDLDAISQNKRVIEHVRGTNVLIIDEISMLSADTFDMVERVLREVRRNDIPFGGMQIVVVGDFFQLPPVVRETYRRTGELLRRRGDDVEYEDEEHGLPEAPFAFRSSAWRAMNPIVCYLHEQHRQSDADSARVLGALRRGSIGEDVHEALQARIVKGGKAPEEAPRLFSRNMNVDRMNDAKLETVNGSMKRFEMVGRGPAHLVDALKRGCLSPESLALKIGARVMFTKNDLSGRFVNGTLGEVTGFAGNGMPIVKTASGRVIEAELAEWKIDDGGKTLARISQVPLRLSWAMTVHKSQGMTLDAAVIDLSDAFEYGQGYVALSRVRSLDGLHLIGYNERALAVHPQAAAADVHFKQQSAAARKRFEAMSDDEHASYSSVFVTACGGSTEGGVVRTPKKKAPKRVKGDSKRVTLGLLEDGRTIAQVVAERKLAESTIVQHVCELYLEGKLEHDDILRIIPARLKEALPQIAVAFKKHGSATLTPTHKEFGGAFSFGDLSLARLLHG